MNLQKQIRIERKNIFILSMCEALVMTMNSILLTINPLIGYALAHDKSQSTIPIAIFQLAGMISIFPASFLMQHLGRQIGFMIGVLFGILGTLVGVYGIYIKNFNLFALSTFLIGIYNGFAGFYVFAAADAARKLFRSKAISLVMVGGFIAALVGPLLVIWMQKLVDSKLYIGPFISILVFQILTILLLLFLKIPNIKDKAKSKNKVDLNKIFKESKFILSILSGIAANAVMVFIMTATPLAMSEHHHNINNTALSMQFHLLGMFGPSFFTGHLIAKFNSMKVMICGAIVIILSIAINTTEFSLLNISFSMILLGLGWNFMNISSTTFLTEACSSENQAIAQAFYEFIILSSMAFCVYLSGWIISWIGWMYLNIFTLSIFSILFFGIVLALKKNRFVEI